jgi:hypothetical protein
MNRENSARQRFDNPGAAGHTEPRLERQLGGPVEMLVTVPVQGQNTNFNSTD